MDYTPLPSAPAAQASLIVNSILLFVAVLVVILRCIARHVAGAKLAWDDYLMVAALPQGLGLVICVGLWLPTGVGSHSPAVVYNYPYIFQIILPAQLLFVTTVVTVKMSVLIFYYRVFTSRAMRLMTKLTIGLVVVWGLGNLLQVLLVCHITPQGWRLLAGVCPGVGMSTMATGVFNCATNVIISILPIYTIWSLRRVSISTKFHLSAVFLLSTIITVVSIIRIWYIAISNEPTGATNAMPIVFLLTTMEANLSIIVNSTPMLLPLYTWWRYRRVWGEGADDYVSRLRGDDDNNHTRSDRDPNAMSHPHGGQPPWSMVEDIISGVPLEAIYGVDHVRFTTTVRRGGARGSGSGGGGFGRRRSKNGSSGGDSGIKMTATRTRTRSNGEERDGGGAGAGDGGGGGDGVDGGAAEDLDLDDLSDSESTLGLPRNAQATGRAGIQIETKWSITEEVVK